MRRTAAIRRQASARKSRYAAAGFILLSVFVAIVPNFVIEKSLFAWIYGWPGWLTLLFYSFSLLGSAWLFIIVSAIIWFTKKRSYALDIMAAGIVTYLSVQVLKWLIDRPRPFELYGDIVHREVFVTGLGYPSGHTAIATVLGFLILPHLPQRLRWIVPVWIIGVGLSRVYLGVHLPLDVLGGFLLGLIIAKGIKYLREAVKKHKLKLEV